jgi:hypothetical protein
MFLSVPLTMALKIALDANPDTRPIAIMLGPDLGEPVSDDGPPAGAVARNPGSRMKP